MGRGRKMHTPESAKGMFDGRTKAFVRVCESKVLRCSVVVCCGTKAELKKLFFDPKTFDGFAPSPGGHRETWRHLEAA